MRRTTGFLLTLLCVAACRETPPPVRLNVLDPGHFHAALVQKHPLEGVNDTVRVYAPEGPELQQYLSTVASYGLSWQEELHTGEDCLELLPPAREREAVVLAGNNARKSEYILQAVRKGYHVLADKPMALTPEDNARLQEAYRTAEEKGLVILELMTERYDPLNIRIRERIPDLGGILPGTAGDPAIIMESVHHFYKEVSGKPLVRPAWYYDVRCQGEGIADVTTHLIDLVFWQCFPGEAITRDDVKVISASHYPTLISPDEFRRSTGEPNFPNTLVPDANGFLPVFSNGSITFCVKGVYVKMDVRWDFEGGPDTFRADYRCRNGEIQIRQDAATGFRRVLDIAGKDETPDPGPGHEEHFSLVTKAFLDYVTGKEPVPGPERENTLAKYAVTTEAVRLAQ